ncbi:hypothetical protein STAFG_6032 [Streptomyces afghaniensis 772]|uniref:Uncharacterized protein n=1 Tax=Streptomyces afghaniensis 772 TaxID=1283301 RepID=S4NEY0_9ACTN|nr:hypothetical protein [Streptomyces afghaniensis]EPJ36914.1 hypothetical protein STAFG_6032 [Streptomyces afghaniensis 772]
MTAPTPRTDAGSTAHHRQWLEIALTAPPGTADLLLAGIVRPLLTEPPATDAPTPAFFVRGTGPAQPTLSVQLALGPEDGETAREYAARARELAGRLGSGAGTGAGGRVGTEVQVVTGPARLVPLTGSVFDGPALAPFTRTVLADLCPALLAVGAAGEAGRPALLAAAAALMAAHLRGVSASGAPTAQDYELGRDGVPLGFLSYRSHAEAFLATSRNPQAARSAMSEQYARVAPTLLGLVDAVLTQCEGRGPVVSEPARQWFEAVRPAKPTATDLFRSGTELRLLGDEEEQDATALDESAFHRIVGASDGLRDFLNRDPAFLAARLLTSLLYLGLHSAGLTLTERYFLCYAVSRACEVLYETDALTVLSGLAGVHRF